MDEIFQQERHVEGAAVSGLAKKDRNTHILYLEIITTFPILQSGKKVVIRKPSAERAIIGTTKYSRYHRLQPSSIPVSTGPSDTISIITRGL